MRAAVNILDTTLTNSGTEYRIKFQIDTDTNKEMTSELVLPITLTDAQMNASILTYVQSLLESAAGMVFAVGDVITIVNSLNFTSETISVATDPTVASTESLESQLNTLLSSGGV